MVRPTNLLAHNFASRSHHHHCHSFGSAVAVLALLTLSSSLFFDILGHWIISGVTTAMMTRVVPSSKKHPWLLSSKCRMVAIPLIVSLMIVAGFFVDPVDGLPRPSPPWGTATKNGLPSSSSEKNHSSGRVSDDEFILTAEQIERFHQDGCITIPNVLTDEEVEELAAVFDRFVSGEINVPGKDFCDMSKPFGIPYEEWSLVNCMLPTRYFPPLRGNVYERLSRSMARQLFPTSDMVKDYDQLLNKRPGKKDAVFSMHQDMAYWPSPQVLGVRHTDTCTFSLAIDDSDEENGCLQYVVGSGRARVVRPHRPAAGDSREDGHALVTDVGDEEEVRPAPARRGSITIHDEYVVHGSGGNLCQDRQRRTVRTGTQYMCLYTCLSGCMCPCECMLVRLTHYFDLLLKIKILVSLTFVVALSLLVRRCLSG
jgi:phytanoyl-CoA hydroxylase